MKQTKRRRFAAFLMAFLLLTLTACTPEIANGSSDGAVSSGGVPSSAPEESSPALPKAVEMVYGALEFPGIFFHTEDEVLTDTSLPIREFDYSGGELKANLCLMAESGGIAEAGILLFCDGVPTEYTILDSGETGFYHVFQVEGEKIVKISFRPDFDLGHGRIDLHLVRWPNEKPSGTNPLKTSTTETVYCALLPEEYQAEGTYSDRIGNAEDTQIAAMPEAVAKSATNMIRMEVMDSWAKEEDIGKGNFQFEIGEKPNAWICVKMPAPGKYRLVFLLDGEPLALEDGKTVLNCEIGADEMFSTVVPLKQMVPPGEHSLWAVATPVGDQTFADTKDLAAFRYLIVH